MSGLVPEFAVVGHPNEGKSAVLSTLAEDDSVRVSPEPGETTECRRFPVRIDGQEVIAFIDTPGFQNPGKTLRWMQEHGDEPDLLARFIRSHRDDPAFHDDCALLAPLLQGASIIFVVDGSRPLRSVDRAEMEILRLTGRPRLAIINCKEDDTTWLPRWQEEFRKHFNAIRVFNANRATYLERISLLESLKPIDQELEPVLVRVIEAFQADWQRRIHQAAELVVDFLVAVLSYRRSASCPEGREEELRTRMLTRFTDTVRRQEQQTFDRIRRLYKHNIFNLRLPPHSILEEDLFAEKTWEFLGLSGRQLLLAGALGGAAAGIGLDAATFGTSFGAFAALGGILGAAATHFKGRDLLAGTRLLGMRLDRHLLQVGPVRSSQLLYILLDRVFLFYSHVINWAHGRRDYPDQENGAPRCRTKMGLTASWDREKRMVCERFFQALQGDDPHLVDQERHNMQELVRITLEDLTGIGRKP